MSGLLTEFFLFVSTNKIHPLCDNEIQTYILHILNATNNNKDELQLDEYVSEYAGQNTHKSTWYRTIGQFR